MVVGGRGEEKDDEKFLWLLGPFILLVLAIIIAQKLIQIIRKSVEARKQGGVINERRRS